MAKLRNMSKKQTLQLINRRGYDLKAVEIVTTLYLALLVLIASLFFSDYYMSAPLENISLLLTVASLIMLWRVIAISKLGLASVASTYLGVYIIFHFGIFIAFGTRLSQTGLSPSLELAISRWFFDSPQIRLALLASTIGCFAFLLGLGISLLRGNNINHAFALSNRNETVDNNFADNLQAIAFILLFIGIFGWFGLVITRGGIGLLFGSYISYLNVASSPWLGYFYFFISIGFPILYSQRDTRLKKIGIFLFFVWCIFALTLGLRGEVLFPLAATFVLLGRRGFKIRPASLILLTFIVLTSLSFVRESRLLEFRAYQFELVDLNPANTLVELGSSLRPVVEVIRWNENGDPYIYGASYWAPVERAITLFIPFKERLPGTEDDRLLNVLVQQRVGPIGFSPIAEGFRNGGFIGVFIVMLLHGYIVGWLDSLPQTPRNMALIPVIFVPLLIHVRNSFVPVPFQVVVGLTTVFLVHFLVYKNRRQHKIPAHLKVKHSITKKL